MTPAERIRLADALTEATGQPWRVSGLRGASALSLDGATRAAGVRVSVLRAGRSFLLVPDPRGWPHCRRIDLGLHAGRGWLPRLVVAAAAAVREYDAHGPPRVVSVRDRRLAEHYRRLLRADSGATDAERSIARARLGGP